MCLLAMVAAWPAFGQADPPAVRGGPERGGNGLKVGNGRLHLTFDFETRFDSAAGYFPRPGSGDPVVVSDQLSGEALLHIRPGVRLELPGSKLDLSLKGYADYIHYTGLITPGSTNTSRVEAMADLNLTYDREAPIGFELQDHLQRSDQTSSAAIGAGVLSLYNEVQLKVPIRPGGGAFEVTPLLAWGIEHFKATGALPPVGCDSAECDPDLVSTFDYSNVRAGLNARWRFLPKTAVVVDTDFNVHTYARGRTPTALLMHARAGLSGLVTPKIAVTATMGWGKDFGEVAGSALLAQLEANYLLSQTASLKVGYTRTLEPVAYLGLFRDDRGYVEAQALLGGRLSLRAISSLDFLKFQGDRRDTLYKLELGPQYQFERWLVLGAGYLLGVRSSSMGGAGINYSRHEGYVRVSVMY
ncbi:hypothetical protein F0U61_39620 [Archangium violaceum]|uniref:hypothetical protein n=1 Tax=Archangium violaceum TaxID=83451 RepID=UPI002B293660|nr:hypothetical protein F0U61_39620 [Archangium violaceum]